MADYSKFSIIVKSNTYNELDDKQIKLEVIKEVIKEVVIVFSIYII